MNYMKKVAEMLGLEWDCVKNESEVFQATDSLNGYNYKFTERDMLFAFNSTWLCCNSDIVKFLNGTYIIKKLPWKPNENETYWLSSIDCERLAYKQWWSQNPAHEKRYKRGLVFRTEAEAIEHSKEILKMMGVNADDTE